MGDRTCFLMRKAELKRPHKAEATTTATKKASRAEFASELDAERQRSDTDMMNVSDGTATDMSRE